MHFTKWEKIHFTHGHNNGKVYASYDFEIEILKNAFTGFYPTFLEMVGTCYFGFFLHTPFWGLVLLKKKTVHM